MSKCRRNADCQGKGRKYLHCDTVISQCEPCYKQVCNKRKHATSDECCKYCPEYAVKKMGYQCNIGHPRINTKPITPTRSSLKRNTSPRTTTTTTTKRLQTKSTHNEIVKPYQPRSGALSGDNVNIQTISGVNPWLYTTVVLSATFVILVVAIVFFLLFLRKKNKKRSPSITGNDATTNSVELQRVSTNAVTQSLMPSSDRVQNEKEKGLFNPNDPSSNDNDYNSASVHNGQHYSAVPTTSSDGYRPGCPPPQPTNDMTGKRVPDPCSV